MRNLINEIYNCTECYHKTCNKVFYKQRSTPHIAIILQNPGPPDKSVEDEENTLLSKMSHDEKADYHTGELKKWLLGSRNRVFFFEFFSLLWSYRIISTQVTNYQELEEYINSGGIYNDVYFTDGLKCRGNTNDFSPKYWSYCVKKYLKREIESLPNLKLIFAFSSRTWDAILGEFSPEQIQKPFIENKKVTQVHGFVFRANIKMDENDTDKPVNIIPLVHMSPNTKNNTLRSTYFDFLGEGLKFYTSREGD